MVVEVWSDVVCPFCYIGKVQFEKALAEFEYRNQIDVIYRSFELDPQAEKSQKISIYEVLSQKYGRSLDWAKEMNASLETTGKEIGLNLNFSSVIPNNSFDAHRLLKYAESKNLQSALLDKLFSAYFTEGLDISSKSVLLNLATSAGLNAEELRDIIDSTAMTDEVRADEDQATQFGIRGVPAFIFNRKYLVSGAQPVEAFLEALQTSFEESGER